MRSLKLILYVFTIMLYLSCSDDEVIQQIENLEQEETLTQLEIEDLQFLVEEEKLARDVYSYAYNKYQLQIFNNIASSEQQHLNSVVKLLSTYNITNPSLINEGEFNNETLQDLYILLTEKCDQSLLSALEVGNLIEDMDIFDITENEKRTDKIDILKVYSSLKCGSRNHLRNFNNQLIINGGIYSPSYITDNTFNSIINSTNERCGSN